MMVSSAIVIIIQSYCQTVFI